MLPRPCHRAKNLSHGAAEPSCPGRTGTRRQTHDRIKEACGLSRSVHRPSTNISTILSTVLWIFLLRNKTPLRPCRPTNPTGTNRVQQGYGHSAEATFGADRQHGRIIAQEPALHRRLSSLLQEPCIATRNLTTGLVRCRRLRACFRYGQCLFPLLPTFRLPNSRGSRPGSRCC
ncbi:protein of unknown function [Rhodovastum atsumiense]|nr:protein of unknown function [Rhodovastum atsumiense]